MHDFENALALEELSQVLNERALGRIRLASDLEEVEQVEDLVDLKHNHGQLARR